MEGEERVAIKIVERKEKDVRVWGGGDWKSEKKAARKQILLLKEKTEGGGKVKEGKEG